VIFLKKKQNAIELGDFRPISLVPTLMKLLDKIFSQRFTNYMRQNNIWAEEQHGYSPKRGTETALFEIVSSIQKDQANGKQNILCMVDTSKAFDSVLGTLLIPKLARYGILGAESKFVENYVTGRKQIGAVDGSYSREEEKLIGCPQGGNFSCLAFIAYNNDLPKVIDS